jgi:hypothetical protein
MAESLPKATDLCLESEAFAAILNCEDEARWHVDTCRVEKWDLVERVHVSSNLKNEERPGFPSGL